VVLQELQAYMVVEDTMAISEEVMGKKNEINITTNIYY
jgi:hypothetical protein